MSDENERSGGRLRLKARYWIALVVVLLAGLVSLFVVVRRNDVERRLTALRAAGYPTSFAELAEYHKLPEGAPNAADVYERAFRAFVPPVDDVNTPQFGKATLPERGAALPEPMAKAVAKLLADNQPCLTLLHQAAGIERCRYDWDYRNLATGTPSTDIRQCIRLLYLGALFHAQAGDPNRAVGCIRNGLALANSLRDEPALTGYLVRVACLSLTLSGLERSLSLTAPTDAQLQELGDSLSATAGTLDLTQAMVAERCFMIEMYRNPSLMGGAGGGAPVRMPPVVGKMWFLDTLDYMADIIEASRLPPPERPARFRAAEQEVQQLSFLHAMVKTLTPALTRLPILDLRARVHLDLARTALAVERYRLATGRLPDQLEDLVPQYLDRVATDPFAARPLRYERLERGYLIYSVGEDGDDDGGRERDSKNRGAPCDLPFKVVR
jgi:hypothetical protein